MKKFNIFLLLLLVFSCFLVLGNTSTKAEEAYTIKISTPAVCNADKTNLDKYLFCADYTANEQISFTATLTNSAGDANLSGLTYKWEKIIDSNNSVTLTNISTLTLDKNYSESGNNLIYVGKDQHYKVTISGDGISAEAILTVIIEETTPQLIVTSLSSALGMNPSGAYVINKDTQPFAIRSILSRINVDSTTNWYLKTPNSSSYDLFYSGNICPITPTSLISAQNGFGEYKIYAGAQSSSILYTSPIIIFKATANELNLEDNYHIISRVINNTKAEVEAFTFTLENASANGIDTTKILWYINGIRHGKGETFTYEPTNNETFVVEAKYKGASLTLLSTLSTTPKSTGTLKMVLIIAGSVAVLSLIFGLTVRAFNKRRDNVW
ncbi:MAG: hypothetical protein IJ318_00970 [Clostridia bacterium]|nr:hypothetical protein [Clostridia bacterium]